MSSNNSKGKNYYTRGGKVYNGKGKQIYKRPNPSNSPNGPPTPHISEENDDENSPSPYKAWNLYFREEKFVEGTPTHKKIQYFESYVIRNAHTFSFDKIEDNRCFTLDLQIIAKDDTFNKSWSEFSEDLDLNTEVTLNILGLGMYQTIINELKNQSIKKGYKLPNDRIDLPIIRCRVCNHQPILNLKNLKVNYFGKLISVKGTVIRAGNVKLISRAVSFKCGSCDTIQTVNQPDGVYTLPRKCPTKACRSSKFFPLLSAKYRRPDNFQVVKLQELVGDDSSDGGRIPRTVECELTDDLVDSCVPGDDVTITGIVKAQHSEENNKSKQATIFSLYMNAVSIVNNKNQSQTASGTAGIEFNLIDYYAIQKIHSEPNLFKLLVHSLCPGIYGHEMVKAGLLLGLFGGTMKGPGTRAEPHILVVGDPGLGKSQMLQACANVAPRGIFVCGNTSTSSGLTVTMTRESGGEYFLEAGALVLADQGCCCIDEFDKMPTQHSALREAMEQQTVSIAKAGVVCTLPARTTILAAANPIRGHYTKAKTVSENLKIGAALLSRFDLVFILRDKPNQVLDGLLSEHVLALHTTSNKNKNAANKFVTSTPSILTKDLELSLQERLKKPTADGVEAISHKLLRKYIAYAKKYVYPTVSPAAGALLKQFYLELKKKHQTEDCTPVTTRQAQSLFRLIMARAKVELREVATEKDAMDVIELMKYSLVDTFTDDHNALDFSRSQHGSGMSKKGKVKRYIGILQKIAEFEGRNIFTTTELKDIANRNAVDDFFNVLSTLNIQGFLLKKNSNQYKLLSVE